MFLSINWADPTIIGGLIGIFGSIIGAIVGAISTVCLTLLFSKGKVKINVLENEYLITEGLANAVEPYEYVNEVGDRIRYGIKIEFQCLITNSKKEKYSFSNLALILVNRKKHFKKQYALKDGKTTHITGGLNISEKAENYILEEHSNAILKLFFYEKGKDFYSNYQGAKFYINYIDYKGKSKFKRIYLELNNPEPVHSI